MHSGKFTITQLPTLPTNHIIESMYLDLKFSNNFKQFRPLLDCLGFQLQKIGHSRYQFLGNGIRKFGFGKNSFQKICVRVHEHSRKKISGKWTLGNWY